MASRLNLKNVRVIANGIELEGYPRDLGEFREAPSVPVLGFLARMCREKGLDLAVEAFIRLRKRGRVPGLRLKIGGSLSRADEPFVRTQRARLRESGLDGAAEFHPNLSREQKIDFLKSLTVFSVPAVYGEAFGLYVIEAMAAGVPVVQPRAAAFPEIIHATGGGVLCDPGSAEALAASVEELLLNHDLRLRLSRAGHEAVWREFGANVMAERVESIFRELVHPAKTVA
jgi:glycosyltransferase involved in cell wall biosynthesis